jgi:hypothetical protein
MPLGVGFGVVDQMDAEEIAKNQQVLRGCERGCGLFARENAVDEVHIASSSRRNTLQAADCLSAYGGRNLWQDDKEEKDEERSVYGNAG